MSSKPIYKIIFMNQGKVFEIYAKSISHGGIFGFIEIEELIFGTRSSVVVDPSEEKMAQINKAYEVLSDKKLKEEYDKFCKLL